MEIFDHVKVLFHSIELAAREVTGSTPHQKKPSAAERKLTSFLGSDSSSPGCARACEELVTTLHEECLSRANKRVHASLVSGKGMKRALQAHANITNPPVALIDKDVKMSASPQESCDIMSRTLAGLGGDIAYTVPEGVESHFLDQVPTNPRTRAFTPLPGSNFNLSFARPNHKRQ